MAKTRTPPPSSGDPDPKKNDALVAAAQSLEVKGQDSLLYNSQVVDYLANNSAGGSNTLAWYYYSKIPELKFTSRYVANALSVATLYVGEVNPNGAPTRLDKGHPANDLMDEFAGGKTGQSDMLDRLGLHLTVVGDSVLMGPKTGTGGEQEPFDRWRVYSADEVSSRNGEIYIKLPSNSKEQLIPKSILPIRIWRPHPRVWWDADSPVKGLFSVLRELDLLDQHVHASAISRLAGAGLMGIPDELDLPNADSEMAGTEIDKFVALLTEVMGLAIKNRDSAAAMVPIMLRGPAEYIDKIKHFDFSTAFSEMVPELRVAAIRRVALGMDVPPEILLGSSQATSWSAWQIDESTLRVHLIPLLQLIASSLTVGWLRPSLEDLPLSKAQTEQIPKLVVHFDVSNLQIRQDVSGDAQAMYDRFEINSDHLRIATGYSEDSVPDDKELAKQILLQLVRGGTPELVNYALKGLKSDFGITQLPDVPDPAEAGAPGEGGAETSVAPPPVPKVNSPDGAIEPETTPISSSVPGERSQDKQVSPPPLPKIGDQSGNEEKI